MTKEETLQKLQQERDICTEAWFFIKKYALLFPGIPGNNILEDMLLDLERISEMGATSAQKMFAQYTALALAKYVEAQYEQDLKR